MNNVVGKLKAFMNENAGKNDDVLSESGRRVYRSLKCAGERAIKGRDIDKCLYESMSDDNGEVLKMVLEGRHSMSVGNQILRRFSGQGVEAEVVQTKRGAKVIIRKDSEK